MNNITRHSVINYGGICSIKLINIDNVLSVNTVVNDTEYKMSVTLKTGTDWINIYFTPDTENFNESEKITDNSSYWMQKLEFSIPKDRQPVIKELRNQSFTRLMALIEYDNGDEVVVGTPYNPLIKSNKRNISDIGTNLYNILLESKSEFPAYFYFDDSGDSGSGSAS